MKSKEIIILPITIALNAITVSPKNLNINAKTTLITANDKKCSNNNKYYTAFYNL